MTAQGPSSAPETPICRAKACRHPAAHAVVWRNPKLHTPQRRKVWLACDDHRGSLSDFVAKRGFLIEVIPVDRLTDADG